MTRQAAEPSSELAAFGARLRRLRDRLGVSQRWLARETGLTSGALSFIEHGKCCPSAENLARLADVLGVTMDELWRGVERCGSSRDAAVRLRQIASRYMADDGEPGDLGFSWGWRTIAERLRGVAAEIEKGSTP